MPGPSAPVVQRGRCRKVRLGSLVPVVNGVVDLLLNWPLGSTVSALNEGDVIVRPFNEFDVVGRAKWTRFKMEFVWHMVFHKFCVKCGIGIQCVTLA